MTNQTIISIKNSATERADKIDKQVEPKPRKAVRLLGIVWPERSWTGGRVGQGELKPKPGDIPLHNDI